MPRIPETPKKVRRPIASILARVHCITDGWFQGAMDYVLDRHTVSMLRMRRLIHEVPRQDDDDQRLKRWKLTPEGLEALREHNIWRVSFPQNPDYMIQVPDFKLAQAPLHAAPATHGDPHISDAP